jgi:hypothetical protein
MATDPILEEIYKAREDYAKQFNYDLNAMFADLRRRQQESGRKVVSFAKKPAVKTRRRRTA